MRLLNSVTGELVVEFYDNPRQTLQSGLVSVTYTFREGGIERIARDFEQYVGKVLYCLGPSPAAPRLQGVIAGALNEGFSKSTNVMAGDGYRLEWTEARPGATKQCRAKFYRNRPPVTKFSFGGEDYYPPMSCIAFLQYLVDTLPEPELAQLARSLA